MGQDHRRVVITVTDEIGLETAVPGARVSLRCPGCRRNHGPWLLWTDGQGGAGVSCTCGWSGLVPEISAREVENLAEASGTEAVWPELADAEAAFRAEYADPVSAWDAELAAWARTARSDESAAWMMRWGSTDPTRPADGQE